MRARTWLAVGAAGAAGLGIVALGAVAVADTMDLTDEAGAAHGDPVVASGVTSGGTVQVRVHEGAATVTTAPSASDAPSATPTPSATASASTAPTLTPVTPATPVSVVSAASNG